MYLSENYKKMAGIRHLILKISDKTQKRKRLDYLGKLKEHLRRRPIYRRRANNNGVQTGIS